MLRDLKRRGMQALVLGVGDGARLLGGGAGGVACAARTLTMAFKLLMLAQERWRSSRVPLLLPLVRASVWFIDDAQIEYHEDNRKEAA